MAAIYQWAIYLCCIAVQVVLEIIIKGALYSWCWCDGCCFGNSIL